MRRFLFLLFIIPFLFASCSGSQGPTGPSGSDGVANITTKTFTVDPDSFDLNTDSLSFTKSIPEITKQVFNDGLVKVSIQGLTNEWTALPYTWSRGTYNPPTISINYGYKAGQLHISFFTSVIKIKDIKQVSIKGPYKVTIIPPSKMQGKTNASNHKMNLNTISSNK